MPETTYRIYMTSVNIFDPDVNESEALQLKTSQDGAEHFHYEMHPAEGVIIAFILFVWLCAVALFLHKWRRIRILPPRALRYKHNPKNLDTIKVVKRPTDSVIYKSYTRQISTTMQARQKKLERMHTMPNIKLPYSLKCGILSPHATASFNSCQGSSSNGSSIMGHTTTHALVESNLNNKHFAVPIINTVIEQRVEEEEEEDEEMICLKPDVTSHNDASDSEEMGTVELLNRSIPVPDTESGQTNTTNSISLIITNDTLEDEKTDVETIQLTSRTELTLLNSDPV